MAEKQFEALRQAREHYLKTGRIETSVRPFVAEAWARCQAAGMHPRSLQLQTVDPQRTASLHAREQTLVRAAEPVLREVHGIVGDQPHVLALSDAEGNILRLHADPASSGPAAIEANMFEGASWSEDAIGCNGVGTALRTGSPVVLIGAEHYQEAYLGWTCIGIPLRSHDGAIAGVIDFSVPNKYVNAHTWGWMLTVARSIEARLATESPPQVPRGRPFDSLRGILEVIGSHLGSEGQHIDVDALEHKVDEAETHLLQAIGALRERSEELELATRTRDESMAALAHELRGPLFAIISCIDLLRSEGHDQDTVEWARGVLERQASQMRALVDDLMDLARAERGKIELARDEIDLCEVIEQASLAVQQERTERGISLEISVPHIRVPADRMRMVQIMTNLLGNAVRYNRQGGSVLVSARVHENQAEIRVIDTGAGIEPQLLPRIFEPFVQGRMKKRGGLGLGLPLVRRLVELHDGSISIHSEGIDHGTEVLVRLPISVERPPASIPRNVHVQEGSRP